MAFFFNRIALYTLKIIYKNALKEQTRYPFAKLQAQIVLLL